jgi:hypothetical protein
MKIFSFFALALISSAADAGQETRVSGKDFRPSQPCPQWYADNEWDIGVWSTYAMTAMEYRNDRYLDVDHAWGGGLDVKYFFLRYFGLGVEGLILDANRTVVDKDGGIQIGFPFEGRRTVFKNNRSVGSGLATLTVRYPIPCSRFAPYVYAGGGMIVGGGERDIERLAYSLNEGNELIVTTEHTGTRSEAIGQFGGGLEIRLTPHIGIIADYNWNVVNGRANNFGMARTGINLAF